MADQDMDESAFSVQKFKLSTRALVLIISAIAGVGVVGGGSVIGLSGRETAAQEAIALEEFEALEKRVATIEHGLLGISNDINSMKSIVYQSAGKLDVLLQRTGVE